MTFTNPLREQRDRSLKGKRMKGVVVNNDDTKHEDGKRVQRIQVRVHSLHRNIKDDDLPWFMPATLDSSNAANAGTHGPVPPVGTAVFIEFQDDSQYHGQYLGGPTDSKRTIDDFTKKGSQYGDNYPQVAGGLNFSGSLTAHDYKADTEEHTHVTGTTRRTDGYGQVREISQTAQSPANKDAKKLFDNAREIHVHGDCVIRASGSVRIDGAKDVYIVTGAKLHLHSTEELYVSSKKKIALSAPMITVSTLPVLGPGESPQSPTAPTPVTARKRPTLEKPQEEV